MKRLTNPKQCSNTSVEEAIRGRRSIRRYRQGPLEHDQISQLLWAAQGTSSPEGFLTVPSAGGTYPLVIYLVAAEVEGLETGIYHYQPASHCLSLIREGDFRHQLANAAHNQEWIAEAQASLIITAIFNRTTERYGERGIRYVHMEAGHAGQNIYLQAYALNIGTVAIGAFHDNQVKDILGIPDDHAPLYIIPVGLKNK